ncbi:branched-chain amino acid ABC transporter permease [Pelagovum pacificum]|uniref:Branched-chain amino acid ABC transporter permease n=1 Tax=Pelagovum pacificum TaxID=2588711 RepID=A0A5C5G9M6_9RHOB|nr:branched-chain amino acid ABC transporter permease [Pelagovum pacificum]QQA42374.1 branched-chain amino acid ABC transporter permease [Pelagovum pacificum]TNY31458.1 branched-chain amino acid ABC transporter permease [Pelagovum pacificum]
MGTILNILVDGVAYGMILFMISVGLSVTMGLMRVINLAHGGFAMLGGAAVHYFGVQLGIPFVLAALLAIGAVVALALPMERVLYRPIYRMGELQQVLATIGITFLMIASVNLWLGSTLLSIRLPDAWTGTVDLGFRSLPMHRLIVIGVGLAIAGGLYVLIDRTRFGIRLRAAVDNRATASALGIDTGRVFLATFALGAGLAALGGILGAELLPVDAYYPLRYMVHFLIVVAVGGMGSITGSFLAALGLGILDTTARYIVPDFGTIFFFLVTILVLGLRPQGLLGRHA